MNEEFQKLSIFYLNAKKGVYASKIVQIKLKCSKIGKFKATKGMIGDIEFDLAGFVGKKDREFTLKLGRTVGDMKGSLDISLSITEYFGSGPT